MGDDDVGTLKGLTERSRDPRQDHWETQGPPTRRAVVSLLNFFRLGSHSGHRGNCWRLAQVANYPNAT